MKVLWLANSVECNRRRHGGFGIIAADFVASLSGLVLDLGRTVLNSGAVNYVAHPINGVRPWGTR